ncbi:pentapeptide repeat-containing protein [Oscillatoria sp. FACHB-1406]|nr:pentapeptide repeat-containing protein [Oscillatoria sp. FACHB-1406]
MQPPNSAPSNPEPPSNASTNSEQDGQKDDRDIPLELAAFGKGIRQSNRIVPQTKIGKIAIDSGEVSRAWLTIIAIAIMIVGLFLNNTWIGLSGAIVALLLSLREILPALRDWLGQFFTPHERQTLFALITAAIASVGLLKFLGLYRFVSYWLTQIKWDEFGSWAEWFGALGQIMIALLAVYVAWEQYVISKDLTIRQNAITQQQTIDAYFQGISELALDEEGLLEDLPQERAFAEGRTAAILGSVDAAGKAKILRFLSQSRLLTPLKRDWQLGRPISDGVGGYQEDRENGVRVIELGVMLAGADLSETDLRWSDLSDANFVRANFSGCDLVKANFARSILYEANLIGVDFKSVRLFYGRLETASPRSRLHRPDYETGAYTGAVVEKADFTNLQRLNEEQRCYLCAWGGEETRATIPGGCGDIPNRLGR